MKVEVFPTTQALTVTSGAGYVILSQYDEVSGRDAEVYIPLVHVTAACAAIKEAARVARNGE